MNTIDYIIVGQGLSGTALAQRFFEHGLTFHIIDRPDSHQASRVASGIWNPIVLKRMKKVWQADAMLKELLPFYTYAQNLYSSQFIDDLKVNRVFANDKEIDSWLHHCDDPRFEGLISASIKKKQNNAIHASSGLGEVIESGRIKTEVWLDAARSWLIENKFLASEEIHYDQLKISEKSVEYGQLKAHAIVFCEGMHSALHNPYFSYLPFALTKGEVLIIRSEDLALQEIINSSVFVLPLGNNLYKVGATYAWDDLSLEPTTTAREELIKKASKLIAVPFEVVEHKTGIRPTVRDRRPLIGSHPMHKNMYIFNGMGSRGVLMAPYLSKCFVGSLIGKGAIPEEANSKRFDKFYA
jgi:glycine/D-amino acid oxidase-like deaminating enzyme